MPIKVIHGKILCSKCGRLLEEAEPFKLFEFQYEVTCLDCDIKYNLSKKNIVFCQTKLKENLFYIIQKAQKDKKTITIEMDNAKQNLLNFLSGKNKNGKT